MPSPIATPRLVQPQHTVSIFLSSFASYFHSWRPLSTSMGEHVVGAGDRVDDAVVDDRCRLAGVLRSHAGAVEVRLPHALQMLDVLRVDFVERRVALVGQRATVGDPPALRELRERGVGDLAVTAHSLSVETDRDRVGAAAGHEVAEGPADEERHPEAPEHDHPQHDPLQRRGLLVRFHMSARVGKGERTSTYPRHGPVTPAASPRPGALFAPRRRSAPGGSLPPETRRPSRSARSRGEVVRACRSLRATAGRLGSRLRRLCLSGSR